MAQTILVIGVSGMLGNAVIRLLAEDKSYTVFGSTRSPTQHHFFPDHVRKSLYANIDIENVDAVTGLLTKVKPDIVINCVGLVKQLAEATDPLSAIPINSIFPHRLARLCQLSDARLIHVSTDCVFDGAAGNYTENDLPNARDLYGLSKLLGEVDYENAITLRTSIIGHELAGAHGLIGWFLAQEANGRVKGFTRAIFSGLPTVELARVIRDFVIPRPELRGLYHVSAEPISKYDLLKIVADAYGVSTMIEPDDRLVLDRSLNSTRFREQTGYRPASWPELVRAMHTFA